MPLNGTISIEHPVPKKRFLFGLLAAVFSTNVIDVLAPLLYPEIAQTFGIQIGTAVQLSAFSAIAGVITGFVLSAFSIKVRYKTLLMVGVLCIIFCALGVFLAPNFLFAQIFYSLNGVGSVVVGVMVASLIGELYPLNMKAKTFSWAIAAGQIAVLVGNPITGYIANSGGATGWKTALLWFMLPVTIISILLVFFLIPSKPISSLSLSKKPPLREGFREVLSNRSAIACWVSVFTATVFLASNTFASSYLKVVFELVPFQRSIVAISGLAFMILGIFLGGLLVNAVGRKRLTVLASIPAFVFSIAAFALSIYVQNIWLYITLRLISGLFGGIPLVAGTNLALEQVPKFRGTMMSINSALGGTGGAVGILVGGIIINSFVDPLVGYALMMALVGGIGIAGTLVLYFFAKDPCKVDLVP
jgi:predicted MFS family arabinose efflux permease